MANCVHGFPQGQCLICQTLGVSAPAPQGKKAKVASPGRATTVLTDDDLGRPCRPPGTPDAPRPERQRRSSGTGTLLALVAAVVVGGLLVWAFAGVVGVAFHILEFVAVAAIAGWVGYKLGHARGRRGRAA